MLKFWHIKNDMLKFGHIKIYITKGEEKHRIADISVLRC